MPVQATWGSTDWNSILGSSIYNTKSNTILLQKSKEQLGNDRNNSANLSRGLVIVYPKTKIDSCRNRLIRSNQV
jgi:hypothetical protein